MTSKTIQRFRGISLLFKLGESSQSEKVQAMPKKALEMLKKAKGTCKEKKRLMEVVSKNKKIESLLLRVRPIRPMPQHMSYQGD